MGQMVSGAGITYMIGLEATLGTELPTPGTKAKKFSIVSETIKGERALQDSQLIGGDPNPRLPVPGRKSASGTIKTYMGQSSFGLLCLWAMGDGEYTKSGSGPYTHTILLGPTDLGIDTDVEIPYALASKWKRSIGTVCNTFSWGVGPDGFNEISFDALAYDVQQKSSTYSATATDYTAEVPYDQSLLAAADCKIGGSAYAKLVTMDATLSWNRFTDDYRAGADGARGSVPRKRATLKGKARLAMEEVGDWDMILAGTASSFDMKWTIDANYSIQCVIPQVTFSRTDPVVNDDGPMYFDVDWTASKIATGDETSLKFVIMNQISDLKT